MWLLEWFYHSFFHQHQTRREKKEDEEKTYICALTDCNCIYVGGHGNCITCPVREEAEKIGNR